MKKVFLFLAVSAMALTAMTSCSSAATQAEAENTDATEEAAPAAVEESQEETQGAVTVLKDDAKYRPGVKVDKLTLIDFNAVWCGPCKQFAPVFHEVAEKYADKADFVSLDTDVNPETAKAFNVQAIPTLVILYPNGETTTIVGTQDLMPAEKFEAIVEEALAK